MATCRICKEHLRTEDALKYGIRHYAHHACYLDAGKSLEALPKWKVQHFPYGVLRDRGLLEHAMTLVGPYRCEAR